MRPAPRSSAVAGALAAAIAVSCQDGPPLVPLFPAIASPPVKEVIVYGFPNVLEVGDTLTVYASAFDSLGNATAFNVAAAWSYSDSSLVTGVPRGLVTPATLLTGRKAGLLTLSARINGVTGQDTIRVVPRIAQVSFSASSVTIPANDSVRVDVTFRDAAGAAISGPVILWSAADYSVVTVCCHRSAWIVSHGRLGTTTVQARMGHSSGSVGVTVVAR